MISQEVTDDIRRTAPLRLDQAASADQHGVDGISGDFRGDPVGDGVLAQCIDQKRKISRTGEEEVHRFLPER